MLLRVAKWSQGNLRPSSHFEKMSIGSCQYCKCLKIPIITWEDWSSWNIFHSEKKKEDRELCSAQKENVLSLYPWRGKRYWEEIKAGNQV